VNDEDGRACMKGKIIPDRSAETDASGKIGPDFLGAVLTQALEKLICTAAVSLRSGIMRIQSEGNCS